MLERCADIATSSPEDLTAQFGCVGGHDSKPVVIVLPTRCGLPADGAARAAPFLKLGTLLAGSVEAISYGASLTLFDPYLANGQPVFMETCWLPALDRSAGERFAWRYVMSLFGVFMAGVSSASKPAKAMVDKLILSPTTYPSGGYVEFTGRLAPHSPLTRRSDLGHDLYEVSGRIVESRKPRVAAS